MEIVFGIVSLVAILSIPVMLIVSLVKLSRLDERLTMFGLKIEMLNLVLKGQNDANGKEAKNEIYGYSK